MMDLLIALLMSWGAHAIQGVVISVIGNNNNGRMWISSIAGMDYVNIKNILSLWVLFYPFTMWLLMRVVFYLAFSGKGTAVL